MAVPRLITELQAHAVNAEILCDPDNVAAPPGDPGAGPAVAGQGLAG
jgi:hypothetical protein